jgi:UDP-glucose 4-epimerase
MKIVVTGATGFIGKYFVYAARKKHELVVLSTQEHVPENPLFEGIQFVNYRDSAEVTRAVNWSEALVHLAAVRPLKTEKANFSDYQQNVQLLDSLLARREDMSSYKLVNASTKSVYGDISRDVMQESQEPRPTNLYGLSKYMGEQLADFYARNQILTCTHLRFSQVIGWGERYRNMFSVCLDNAIEGRPQSIWGEGRGRRSYIYAKDAAHSIALALNYNNSGVYNICWPESYSHLQVAETINEVFQNNHIEFFRDKPEDSSIQSVSPEKAQRELEWEPLYPDLRSALEDMNNDKQTRTAELFIG